MFLRELLKTGPIRVKLDFGLEENVRLLRISNEVRKYKGEIIEKMFYLTVRKYNPEDLTEGIAEEEFSYYMLDHTNEKVMDSLATITGHMQNICDVMNIDAVMDPTAFYEGDATAFMADIKSSRGCKGLSDRLWAQFSDAVSGTVGESAPLMRMKVITNKKGNKNVLPYDLAFVESMEVGKESTKLSISTYEIKNKRNGLTPATETSALGKTGPSKSIAGLL